MIDLSPLKPALQDKPILVVGLGKSGMPVYEACSAAGIKTLLWDDGEAARKAAADKGATLQDPATLDFSTISLLCLSPGIPLTHPQPHPAVTKAKEAGIEVLGDIELFHRAKPRARTIGITGTNGKSTTTALIGHILKEAKVPSAVGGNIGEAVLTLPDLGDDGIYVIEMSSYQTDLSTTFAPQISLLVNLSPDHLDRHGDMAGYIAAKERMFRGAGLAVISLDDEGSVGVYDRLKKQAQRKITAVSCERPLMHGVFVSEEGVLFDGKTKIITLHTAKALKGKHNWQNAAMAYAACRDAGLDVESITKGMQSFPGLIHRQNFVTAINGVAYINDSKATNDQAAAMALRTFDPIYWIAGGKGKEGGYADCEKYLSHVRHAFLIGAAEEEMAVWLEGKNVPLTRCGVLERAVAEAHALAQKDAAARVDDEKREKPVVLLAPACASLDQFKSFEHRGDVFVALVKALIPDNDSQNKIPAKTATGGAA